MAENLPTFTPVQPLWLTQLAKERVDMVKGFKNFLAIIQGRSNEVFVYREKMQDVVKIPIPTTEGESLDIVYTQNFHKEVLLLDVVKNGLEKRSAAIDLGTTIVAEGPLAQQPSKVKVTNHPFTNFSYNRYQDHGAVFSKYKALINFDITKFERVKSHEKFLLQKGFIMFNFRGDPSPVSTEQFLFAIDLPSFKEATIIIDSSVNFLNYLEVAPQFPNVRHLILHNLSEALFLVDSLEGMGFGPIPASTEIFIISQVNDPDTRCMRELLGLLKSRMPNNTIFYQEYPGGSPHLYEGLLVSLLG